MDERRRNLLRQLRKDKIHSLYVLFASIHKLRVTQKKAENSLF